MQIALLALTFVSCMTVAADKAIAAKHLLASSQNYQVTHGRNGFAVNGKPVSNADLSPELRNVSSKRLAQLFASDRSKLHVTRVGNDFAITKRDQLKGGGPISAGIAYWLTKSLIYGTAGGVIGAGVGAAVTIAGPVAGPIVAAATSTVGAGTVTAAAGVTCATTVTGAGAVAAAVAASPVLAEGAAMVAASSVASGMTFAGFVAGTEGAALAASSFFLALPLP